MIPSYVKRQLNNLTQTSGLNQVDYKEDNFYDRVVYNADQYPRFFIWKHINPKLVTKKIKILKIVQKESPNLYCQGLKQFNNKLIEAAGKYNESKLVAYSINFDENEPKLEKIAENDLQSKQFAEGIAIDDKNNKTQMLTYKEKELLTFEFKFNEQSINANVKDIDINQSQQLQIINSQSDPIFYENEQDLKEGWGLELVKTPNWLKKEQNYNNERVFVASDGSEKLFWYSQPEFKLIVSKPLLDNFDQQVVGINEMEQVGDELLFNLQQTDSIGVQDVTNDKFKYYIDAGEILGQESDANSRIWASGDVLNCIAQDGKHYILTGKHQKNQYYVDFV